MSQTIESQKPQAQAQECKSSIEKLEDRERKLTEQLKAIQLEIRTKKQRQAALETNRKRKERNRNLLLLGLAFSDLLAAMPTEKAEKWQIQAMACFENAHAPGEEKTEKEAEKFENDCRILKIALEKAAKGEAI